MWAAAGSAGAGHHAGKQSTTRQRGVAPSRGQVHEEGLVAVHLMSSVTAARGA